MKKTMLALMATVGLAFGAKADLPTTTGFENGTFDVATQYEWSAATTNGGEVASLELGVVTNYVGDAAPKDEKLPKAFKDTGAGEKYLSVDTSGDILYRNVNNRSGYTYNLGDVKNIEDGLYFDASVQFTASDSAPEPNAGDKLIVWLSADDEAGTTNLVVTASSGYDEITLMSQSAFNYTNNNQYIEVNDNEWHRLTVAAATEDTMTTFKVYVDGKLVTADGVTDGKFKSLVGSGDDDGYNTLTAVGFQGTGALDNLVWAAGDPFPPAATYNFTLDVTAGGDYLESVSFVAYNSLNEPVAASEQGYTAGSTVNVPVSATKIVITAVVTTGYKVADEDAVAGESNTYTITLSEISKSSGETLTRYFTITSAGGSGSLPTAEADGATLEVEEDVENPGVYTITVETGAVSDPAKIKLVFDGEYNVTRGFEIVSNGDDTFTATLQAPTLAQARESEDAEPEAEELFTFDGGEVTVSVDAVPGLFYGISCDDELPLEPPEELTQYDGTNKEDIFKVDVPSATKGFFKVYVGTSEEVPVEE